MKLTIGCCLLSVALLVLVQTAGSDASSDHLLSRHKRGFIDNLIDGLINKFSETFSKIFKLNPDDFETFIRSLGRISKTVAKNILKKFFELKDKNFDFGPQENVNRLTTMMDTLEEVESQDTSGASTLSWSIALCVSLVGQLILLL